MSKDEVMGVWCALRQVMDASAYLSGAVDAAMRGDKNAVDGAVDKAVVGLTWASVRAKAVYDGVRERAKRTNKRRAHRRSKAVRND
jgi:hypothetical protein